MGKRMLPKSARMQSEPEPWLPAPMTTKHLTPNCQIILRKVKYAMDTEQFVLLHGNSPSFASCIELDSNDLTCVEKHVELARHIKEIYGLYRVFLFNIEALRGEYDLFSNGAAYHNGELADAEDDYYKMNAFIISILTSGKALKDSMETFVRSHLSEGNPERLSFEETNRSLYDGCFSYKFLLRLRDYTQHAHLPVDCFEGVYCFNIATIQAKPHFKHNAALEAEMIRFRDEMIKLYDSNPTLSLTWTLAEYVSVLLSLLSKFFDIVRPLIYDSTQHFSEVVSRYSSNVINGGFVYAMIDNFAHLVDMNDNTNQMVDSYCTEVVDKTMQFQQDWAVLTEGTICIRRTEKGIELSIMSANFNRGEDAEQVNGGHYCDNS